MTKLTFTQLRVIHRESNTPCIINNSKSIPQRLFSRYFGLLNDLSFSIIIIISAPPYYTPPPFHISCIFSIILFISADRLF